MRADGSRLRAAAVTTLCAAALLLAALGQGCARVAPPPQSVVGSSTPAPNTGPAPSPATSPPLPPPDGFVNDFADVIDARTEEMLEAKFGRLRERARIEFAVVTVETTGGQDIFDYSLALARGWGVGPPAGEEGGGLLLMLAVKDDAWRLQVSRSLESDLPDDVAASLGAGMRPALRAGRYGEAVNEYADALVKRLAERRGFPAKDGGAGAVPSPQASPAEGSKTAPRGGP